MLPAVPGPAFLRERWLRREKIYRRSPCPVLTIGPNVCPLKGSAWKLNTILFPTDGSEASSNALPYALSLAEENLGVRTQHQLSQP
jgi:hypothetical protein